MTENIISFIGVFLKHVIGVLLLCWRRMLRAGVVAFAIGVVLALLVAVIATGQAFPGALALVAALLFGAVLAYGVALTVLVEEFVLGVIDLMHLLEGDAKAVAHITETVTEREVGQVGQGLRRLIGLSVAASARSSRAAAPPSLPTLPKYPAAPATAARPAHPASSARSTGVASAALEAAAMAGAAALAARAARPSAAPTPAPAAPTANAAPAAPETPKGEPVRADMLPRIGWTYEHEAVKPTRSVTPAVEERLAVSSTDAAEEPETLAALAGVSVVAATDATSATDVTSAASEEPASAQIEPLAAPAQVPAPTPPQDPTPEPMDVAVVSATALGAHGPVAPTVMMDDAPPLEDERLAEPVALAVPDEETAPAVIASAPAVEPALDLSLDPPLNPAMLTPAPSTTPLPQDDPPAPVQDEAAALDPAMLTPAPATTPLLQDEESQPEPAAQAEQPVTEEPAAIEGATVVATLAPLPAAPAAEAEPEVAVEPAAQPEVAAQPDAGAASTSDEPTDAPPPRSTFSRITRPVGGLGAALDALSRTGVTSGPRASTPESGLWERLSQALIDRSGAPSSPFSAPQSPRANTPDVTPDTASDASSSEPDETPQA